MESAFNWLLIGMTATAVLVFVCLYYIKAGYGLFFDRKWGAPVANRVGWMLMEVPVFVVMALLWVNSPRAMDTVPLIFFTLFEVHYFQRSFIFPLLMRGHSKMPLGIVTMGVAFNVLNALMQGGWIFWLAPADMYTEEWLYTPQFWIGLAMFIFGMTTNIQSDRIIRNLRAPGDTNHYLPSGGMFNYVTSANYFGEFVEWTGFAVMTWSLSGAVFAIWTFANLAPRAHAIFNRYEQEFGQSVEQRKLKRIIPFIY
ncbi:MAG: DUF1295 domain-containing protein [Mucinivorans sp.]